MSAIKINTFISGTFYDMIDIMLDIKCTAPDTVLLTAMVPFQGTLKKRSTSDIEDLMQSLSNDGLIMPFALWQNEEGKYLILDGHGRYEACVRLALQDPTILTQELPVILIKAATEDDARKALVQIVSMYGRIDKKGVIKFTATIPNYTAPVIRTIMKTPVIKVNKPIQNTTVLMKLKVPRDKVAQLTAILKEVSGIEVY